MQSNVEGYRERNEACRYVAQQASTPECAPCDDTVKPIGCGRSTFNLSATVDTTITYSALGRECAVSYRAAADASGEYAMEVSLPVALAEADGGTRVELAFDANFANPEDAAAFSTSGR